MSNISQTIQRYTEVCRASRAQPSAFILKVLDKEKQLAERDSDRPEMLLYLAGNNKLVTDVRLGDADVRLLFETLKNNTFVTSLDLRYNNITDEGAKHIAKLIEETPTLKEINLMCNDFGEDGAEAIAEALQKNETLKSLRLNGNKMGNKGGMFMAQMLQINTTLESLDVGDTDLKTESLVALATVLNYNTTLTALNVSRPLLFSQQEETTVHYANMLKVNSTLRHLDLMKCDLKDFGAARLSENLMDNFTLTHLNLSCNRITQDGAKELAKLIKRDTTLRVLDLGFNRIQDDGAIHLAESLSAFNTHLTTLVLVSNQISGKGLCALADSMKLNTTLTNVYIWGNRLEESARIAFASMIENGRLEPRDTDVQPYVVDGVTSLAELNHGVRKSYYYGAAYGDQSLPELAQFT